MIVRCERGHRCSSRRDAVCEADHLQVLCSTARCDSLFATIPRLGCNFVDLQFFESQ